MYSPMCYLPLDPYGVVGRPNGQGALPQLHVGRLRRPPRTEHRDHRLTACSKDRDRGEGTGGRHSSGTKAGRALGSCGRPRRGDVKNTVRPHRWTEEDRWSGDEYVGAVLIAVNGLFRIEEKANCAGLATVAEGRVVPGLGWLRDRLTSVAGVCRKRAAQGIQITDTAAPLSLAGPRRPPAPAERHLPPDHDGDQFPRYLACQHYRPN